MIYSYVCFITDKTIITYFYKQFNHFAMINHMKKTSLYDVFEYEEKLVEPMEILVYDNEKLKKEVNDLRKQLGLSKKYRDL